MFSQNGNGAVPLSHQWHRATRCSWTLLWRRACLAHAHIVWNQLTWHIRIPFFPYFYSKIHEKSHVTILFWPSTSPSFFIFGLDGMISCSFLENPHLPQTIHVFYWADTRGKNDRIWICNSNQTTTFRTKVSTTVFIELRRFRHEKHVRFLHRLGAPTRPCCPTKSLAPARRLPRSVALGCGDGNLEVQEFEGPYWIQYIETIGHVILIYGNSYIYIYI